MEFADGLLHGIPLRPLLFEIVMKDGINVVWLEYRHLRVSARNNYDTTKTLLIFKLHMGIRFYCPNGHKLNVKEKLAGKRGICPHCQVRLLIPHKSTRSSSREERAKQDKLVAGAGGNPNNFDVFADNPSAKIALFDHFTKTPPDAGQSPTKSTVAASVPASAFDDPDVIWYVQFPDGQRFGPATLPIIQAWVKERRISPTMLVWREGWPDWLEAGLVFPEIVRMFQKSRPKKSKYPSDDPNNRLDDQRLDTGDSHGLSTPMITAIVLTILILGAVLFYLLKP